MTELTRLHAVMVVDDEEIDQLMYRRVIDRSGMVDRTFAFRYAGEALDFLEDPGHPEIDAIFLDINMPRMSGFEFLERATATLGGKFARAVVVMLTTSLDPRDRARAMSFDVVKDYINKPLTVDHLRHVAGLVAHNPQPG